MNEQELKEALKARLGSTRAASEAASEAVEVIFDVIIREVAKGGTVEILGFGTFEPSVRDVEIKPMDSKGAGWGASVSKNSGQTVNPKVAAEPKFMPSDAFRAVVADPSRLSGPKAKKVAPTRTKTKTKTKTKKETPEKSTTQMQQPTRHRKIPVTRSSGPSARVRARRSEDRHE